MDYEKVEELSPNLQKIFYELQTVILNDYGPSQANSEQIYRFLKARDFDPTQAENMLRKHIHWRRNMEELSKTFKYNPIQEKYWRLSFISYVNQGYPLLYGDVGSIDIKGLLKSVKASEVSNGLMFNVLGFENHLEAQSKKLGRRMDQWIMVVNFENLHISQILYKPNIDYLLNIFSLYESNFPERLHTAFAINASSLFTIIFNIIKPVLSAHTLSKLKIFGRDGWKDELLKLINADDLPVYLGGKKTGPDGSPYCNIIRNTDPIPKCFYFRSPERRLRGKENVREYILKKNAINDVIVVVKHYKSEIVWNFESETGNISFSLLFQSKQFELEEILPPNIVNAHMEQEQGSYSCVKTGNYIFRLDNTHSWLRDKHIFCEIYVMEPNGEKCIITY